MFDINKLIMESIEETLSEANVDPNTGAIISSKGKGSIEFKGGELPNVTKAKGGSVEVEGGKLPTLAKKGSDAAESVDADSVGDKIKNLAKEHGTKGAIAAAALGAGYGALKLAKKLRSKRK